MTTETTTDTPNNSNGYTPGEYNPTPKPPRVVRPAAVAEADLRHGIAQYIRQSLDENTRRTIIETTEAILAEIIEQEVAEVLAPRFESMYEGVVAQVVQKLLLKALTERAQSTLTQIAKG